MELGDLSAKYESAKAGVAAVGWDSGGGLSLGTYQLASRPGTLAEFVRWCARSDGLWWISDALSPPLALGLGGGSSDRQGPLAQAWRVLASARPDELRAAERGFIRATHYDAAVVMLAPSLRAAVQISEALSQVLWSAAVQHGAAGAAKVFGQAWADCRFPLDQALTVAQVGAFIRAIYARRCLRLARLTAREQTAVRNRYRQEERDALRLAGAA